jgi:hypothetical protein
MVFSGIPVGWWSQRWLFSRGRSEELVLEVIQRTLELCGIKVLVLVLEGLFGRFGDTGVCQEPAEWCLGLIIVSREAASGAKFFTELHHRLEEVGVEPESLIELLEKCKLPGVVIAVVADGSADDGVVLLFDKAVVVLAIGAAAGEGNRVELTVAAQFVVDELTAIVRVDPQKREGELSPDDLESLKNVALRLVFDGSRFGPPRGHVSRIEGLGVLSPGRTTVVGHQVDFEEAGPLLVPLGKGPDRDVVFEQRTGPGMGTGLEAHTGLQGGQQSVDGGWTDPEELPSRELIRQGDLPTTLQDRERLPDEDDQAFTAEPVGDDPEALENLQHIISIAARPISSRPGRAGLSNDEDNSLPSDHPYLSASTVAQGIGRIGAAVACQLDELVEDL